MSRSIWLAVSLSLISLLVGCGEDDKAPTPTGPTSRPASNRAPQASESIPDQTVLIGDDVQLNMRSYFSDPDQADIVRLTYEATSSNTHVVTVSVSGTTVTLTARHLERADVRVTASDPDGLTATQRFSVRVEQGGDAIEREVTACRNEGSSGVRIEGYIRARRRVSNVSVTGYVNLPDNTIGTQHVGDMPAGRRENITIRGTSPIPLAAVTRCGFTVRGNEGSSASTWSAEFSSSPRWKSPQSYG